MAKICNICACIVETCYDTKYKRNGFKVTQGTKVYRSPDGFRTPDSQRASDFHTTCVYCPKGKLKAMSLARAALIYVKKTGRDFETGKPLAT